MNWDYVAGFFDGEGCMYIAFNRYTRNGKRCCNPHVQIIFTNTDKIALEAIADFLHAHDVKCGLYCCHRNKIWKGAYNAKDLYSVRITSHESMATFVNAIKSKIISKNEKMQTVENALLYIQTARHGNREWTDDQKNEFEKRFIHTRKYTKNQYPTLKNA